MKIKVFEAGETLIDADEEYQEPVVRAALAAGRGRADAIAGYTDRSDITDDDYAVASEDDGRLLWHGWLSGDRKAEPPPQARHWFAGMPAADRAAESGRGR